jgi:hypothetical protein
MPPHYYGYGRRHSSDRLNLTDADRFAPHNNSSSNGTLIRSNVRKQHRDALKKLSSSQNSASTDSTAVDVLTANMLMERVMASGRRGSLSLEDEFPDANNHLKDHTAINQHDCPSSPPSKHSHSQVVQETFQKYKEIYEAMLQGVFDDIDDLDCKLVHHNRSDDSSTTAAEVTVEIDVSLEVEPSSPVVDEKEVNINKYAIVVVDRLQQRGKKRDPPTTTSSASVDSAVDDDSPTPIEDRGVDPPTTTALTITTAHDADNSIISDADRSKTLADLVAGFHELQDIHSQGEYCSTTYSNDDLHESHDVMSLISSKFHHQKEDDKRGEDLKEEEEGNNNKEKKEEDALVLVKKKTGNMKEKENTLVPVDKKKRSSSNDRGRQRKSRRPSTGKEQSNSSGDVEKSHNQGSKPSSPRKSRSPHHGRRRTRSPSPTPSNNEDGEGKGAASSSRSKSPFDMLRSISPFGRSKQEDASSSSRYRGRSLSLSWRTSNAETTGDEKKSAKLFRKMKTFASSSLKILPSAGSSNSLHKFRVGDMAKYKISSRVRNLDGLNCFMEGDDKLCIVRVLEAGEDGVLELPLYKILLPNGAKRQTNSKFLSACSKQQATKGSSYRSRYEEESRRRSRSSSNHRSSSRSSSRRRSRSRSAESSSSPSSLSSSSHHSSSNNNNRRSRSSSSSRRSSSSSLRRSPSPYEKKNSSSGRDRLSSRSKQRKNKSDGDHLTGKSSFGESEVTAKTTNKRRK